MKRKRPPRPVEPLERACVPWLLACALATGAPHVGHLPSWLGLLAGAAIGLRAWLWQRERPLPPRWALALVVAAASAGVYFQYRTLFGRDPGVALLVLFVALKPLEMHGRRDAIVVVMLGFFLLLTHYFYSQSIPTGLWLLAAATLQTATLLRIFGGRQPLPEIVRYAGVLLLQATPFMLVLFLLFPRITGPLWGLPQDAHAGSSGLPETIAPGTISNLVLNGNIAFRVRFAGPPPDNARLYWRGPVMDEFDGLRWRPAQLGRLEAATIEHRGGTIAYETTLEPHNQRWLLALDAPRTIPEQAFISGRLQAIAFEPVRLRSRFAFTSSLDYRASPAAETRALLAAALRLPTAGNPRARALAAEWKARHASVQAIVAEALLMFGREQFGYTLQPPLLGDDPVDQFLFETKRGFCEHYASAFVFLMRAAGIPARVVAGYQGGELNPVDGYLVVRQSDAHAWAEVWQEGVGWQRVDPTAATAPSRIERGIASALPESDALPMMARLDIGWLRQLRYRWDAINNAWNQWVLGYNPERQREMLSRLGLDDIDWRGMTALLAVLCAAALLVVTLWTLAQRPRLDPAQRAWLRFCARLARLGVPRHAWEGPLDYAARVAAARPEFGKAARSAAAAYAATRYGGEDDDAVGRLRAATRKLPYRWRPA
ncbi:transglutaminase TgpA family protein [Azospira restricta]|uniref:DUF3488 domain-containing transglutaminase family protein n=1 Tax=Azospira restricta TaxID=404405 RepID=A0A974SLE3_9RHOO|nr:DUF3488 and transglutaminase-like domain-containing protein [Azospira restricta]QRJ62171.1 DUF3488 domain-containing transglutaminase family protein [Azospira restricta]